MLTDDDHTYSDVDDLDEFDLIDPRSPLGRNARTPISKRESSTLESYGSLNLDPRSPALDRTPLKLNETRMRLLIDDDDEDVEDVEESITDTSLWDNDDVFYSENQTNTLTSDAIVEEKEEDGDIEEEEVFEDSTTTAMSKTTIMFSEMSFSTPRMKIFSDTLTAPNSCETFHTPSATIGNLYTQAQSKGKAFQQSKGRPLTPLAVNVEIKKGNIKGRRVSFGSPMSQPSRSGSRAGFLNNDDKENA